jgi:hypothetical protein
LWMALGKLPNGRPATLPIQHDWTVVGWLSPPYKYSFIRR